MWSILGMLLKLLPYVVPILKGLFGALNNLGTAENKEGTAVVDMEKLQEFIEARTTQLIKDTIAQHRAELIVYVPTEEEQAREKRIDELLEELKKASTPPSPPSSPGDARIEK